MDGAGVPTVGINVIVPDCGAAIDPEPPALLAVTTQVMVFPFWALVTTQLLDDVA
jgi:hypothetical protein